MLGWQAPHQTACDIVVVCSWKTFFNSVVNTALIMCKGWPIAAMMLLSSDVSILKVISDRLSFVSHRVSQMLNSIIYWYKGNSSQHLYLEAQVWVGLVFLLKPNSLNLAVDGLREMVKTALYSSIREVKQRHMEQCGNCSQYES